METAERTRLPIAEIEALYPGHFILIGDPEVDDDNRIISGIVLVTDPDKKELFRKAGSAKPGRFALHRTKKESPGTIHLMNYFVGANGSLVPLFGPSGVIGEK